MELLVWPTGTTLSLLFCLESSPLVTHVETMELLVWHTLALYFFLFGI